MTDGLSDSDRRKAESVGIRFFASQAEQEEADLREALKRTPEERFFFLMKLIKAARQMEASAVAKTDGGGPF